MKNLTVAKRLTLGFGLLSAMLLVAIVLGLTRLGAVNDMMDRIVSTDWKKTVLANDSIDLMNANARESFLLLHAQDRGPVKQRIAANVQSITAKLDELDKLIYKPEGKALLADIREKRKTYVNSFQKVGSLLDGGKDAEAARLMVGETVQNLDGLLDAVNKLIMFQGKILEETGEAGSATYAGARNLLMAFMGIALLAAAALATWIIRSVTGPLGGEPPTKPRPWWRKSPKAT
ncbi:MAG: MCP four helix bundle domain-containing protein [Rhodocyclaceae bacterium]|nr:MCP four helix bundle domain-containing protein [Rhodocyclaceae bacterium]